MRLRPGILIIKQYFGWGL